MEVADRDELDGPAGSATMAVAGSATVDGGPSLTAPRSRPSQSFNDPRSRPARHRSSLVRSASWDGISGREAGAEVRPSRGWKRRTPWDRITSFSLQTRTSAGPSCGGDHDPG